MILITGANGFIGSSLYLEAIRRGSFVRCAKRSGNTFCVDKHAYVVGDINHLTDWREALLGCTSVVHCAAQIHATNSSNQANLEAFRLINVEGTLNLARQAALFGIKRFVFVSSIKVNGGATRLGIPFTSEDLPAPEDAYAISKAEAEQGLLLLAKESGMDVVIIRPPLVYGYGVKGNFSSLIRLVARRFPIPLGAVQNNRRSFLAIDNLVDFIFTCIVHPKAANEIFLVSDGADLSTSELLSMIGHALNRPPLLLNVPVVCLVFVATLLGKKAEAERLLGNLQLDTSHTYRKLGWKPPISVATCLHRAVHGLCK